MLNFPGMRLIDGLKFLIVCTSLAACSKKDDKPVTPPAPPAALTVAKLSLNGTEWIGNIYGAAINPQVTIKLSAPVARSSATQSITLTDVSGVAAPLNISYQSADSLLVVTPSASLPYLKRFTFRISNALSSVAGGKLLNPVEKTFFTGIDSSSKYPLITDEALLTLVQQQTFKYFWDFAHPVSGLARERSNGDNETVTSGGSGFGIMAMPVAISRNFISRADGLARMQKIVGFLKNNAVKVKGAFPHWLNGSTGAIIPFSQNDDGADLVETSYLMAGLLTARQYFSGADAAETTLRNDINELYSGVEWDWFTNGGQNVLYWHYSATKGWIMNLPIRGWNECLITYILAAASPTHTVSATVYTNGWAGGTEFINGNSYYGYKLPLGPRLGGPLFLSQYSFMGINPRGLKDAYADYDEQTKNHTLVNYIYCKLNPAGMFGYSDSVWGLTASDIPNGYDASSPTRDLGVIAPTAALSSFAYTPAESMQALKFYYYVLGDKLFKNYGFVDAFKLSDPWFAESFLAIDQGPIIVMMENYRTGLIWNLLTSSAEVKTGMKKLGFTAPYL